MRIKDQKVAAVSTDPRFHPHSSLFLALNQGVNFNGDPSY
jgi:hypothetical protein